MKKIKTNLAPEAIGPYSQAIKVENFLYLSGQIGLNPETMKLVAPGIQEQTYQVCNNIKQVLVAAGYRLQDVVKTTIYLANIQDFLVVNKIYGEYFSHKPARSTVEVSKLPLGAMIEIEVIAYQKKKPKTK